MIHPNSGHFTRKCKHFWKKSVQERNQIVKDLKACKLCLSISHIGEVCPYEASWKPCGVNNCEVINNRLLHEDNEVNMHIQATVQSDSNKETRTLLLMQEVT